MKPTRCLATLAARVLRRRLPRKACRRSALILLTEAQYKTSDLVLPDGQVPDIGSMTGAASVAFTLKPGEISGPINAGNTGAVLTVIDRQAPTEQDYAAKKDQIRDSLMQQKQTEVF